ncbi:protein FAM107B-like [Centruroides sculpturatus]|uniref:protein FAM107B-like n=1 Tax=Centruroides sculpturatus TaxID=218467 RepID=UPI000C6E0197|nr:protein FAM107B-like [Centruroides sculpturatus]
MLLLSSKRPSPDIIEYQKKISCSPINVYYPRPIPEPDYSDNDESCSLYPSKTFNPCLQSSERRQLHRELLWYTKMGRDILRPKTELKTVLEAVRCKRKKPKEIVPPRLTELEMKLQERRKRLEQMEEQKDKRRQKEEFPEFVRVRSRIFPFLSQDLNSDADT